MSNKGYTLIEVMVAVAVFSIVVAGPTGLLVTALRNQRRVLSQREIMDNISYISEYISRNLRMAKKELDCINKTDPATCTCLTSGGYGASYEITRAGKGIKFNNYKDPTVCYEFFWDENDNRLKQSENGGAAVPMTSDDSEVTLFSVKASGEGQNDDIQPRVTMVVEITRKDTTDFPKVKLQTTISQRNLDILY